MGSMRTAVFSAIENSRWCTVYLLTAALLAVGVFFDISPAENSGNNWFPRFGATIAAFFAFVAFFDPRQRSNWVGKRAAALAKYEEDKIARGPSKTQTVMLLAQRMSSRPTEEQQTRRSAMLQKERETDAIKRNELLAASAAEKSNADRSVNAQQVCILVGTFVGVFGDFLTSFFTCGALKC